MSLDPKHRLGAKASRDISDYNEIYPPSKKSSYFTNNRHDFIGKIRWKQILILYLLILSVIHYFERVKPYYVFNSCLWKNWENWPEESDPHHSIIIGDPQIVDNFSYPSRTWLELTITKLLSDNYLHRNYNIYSKVLNPDSIIYVGDLFDGGREWADPVWMKEYIRFNKVFNPLQGVRQLRQIPGNHDIGFGNGINFGKYSRFKAYFGNADEVVILGNHSIVLMDTVSISCSDNKNVNGRSSQFLHSFEDPLNPYKKFPRIVISHVPLYRFTEIQGCGPLRESKKDFPVSRGNQYQTVLEYELSQKIVNWIRPIMLFSGDDHDYCHIRHPFDKSFSKSHDDYQFTKGDHPGLKYTDEITVKSSAMTGGIKKPAIQLLSLWNPNNIVSDRWSVSNKETKSVDAETAETYLCYLPSPYQPLIHYGIAIAFSIWWIFVCTVQVGFGNRLNTTFSRYVHKLQRIFQKLFKKDIKSIDMVYLDAKNSNIFEKYLNKFIDWEVESHRDWRSFLYNSSIILCLTLLTLLYYINSI